MPRVARHALGGLTYHVLNRGNGRRRLFRTEGDYAAFLAVLAEALARRPGIRLLAFCVMPNHFHLVVRPTRNGELSAFMRWLMQTHTQRWRHAKQTVGQGALYQGRFKSFVVQDARHLLVLCRYVERSALRDRLCRRAEAWPWGSAWMRSAEGKEHPLRPLMRSDWPVDRPGNWLTLLNTPQPEVDEAAVQTSIVRNRPFGDLAWLKRTVARLGLMHTLRPPGRPRGAADKRPRRRRNASKRAARG